MPESPQSKAQILMRTLAMPKDTNSNGDIFGGWLVSQMDLGAGIMAKQRCNGRAVTIAINSMTFIKPVQVGDIVTCYGELIKEGRTSMTIKIEAFATPATSHNEYKVTEGVFVFVAIDENGQPRPIDS